MSVRVLGKLIKDIGPLTVSGGIKNVADLIESLLRKNTGCQRWDEKDLSKMELSEEEQEDLMMFEKVFALIS